MPFEVRETTLCTVLDKYESDAAYYIIPSTCPGDSSSTHQVHFCSKLVLINHLAALVAGKVSIIRYIHIISSITPIANLLHLGMGGLMFKR